MTELNCWEFKACGREPGGSRVTELGPCPAATELLADGTNGGQNGGRICWAVAGTFCGGEARGTFATQEKNCAGCDFFRLVQAERGASLQLLKPGQTTGRAMLEDFTSLVSIVDSINAVVYVADLETYELLFVNPYAASLFGRDAVGKPCFKVLQAGQGGRCAFCTNDRLVVNGQPAPPVAWEFQNTVTGRWFHCVDKAIRWWDGRLVRMEIAFDITDQKEAQRFHEEYVGLISHDLCNPLNALMLRAKVLQRSLLRKGLAQEVADLDQLLTSAKQMNALINDLVEHEGFDRKRLELRRVPVGLDDRIAVAVARIASASERERITVVACGGVLRVSADPIQIDRVIDNLLSNALKYSGDRAVRVVIEARDGEALVAVVDEGVGVPADELPKLFQRLYRASSAAGVKGHGLGLYNARLIVEAHGGRIWAESELHRGSAFRFTLPLAEPAASNSRPVSPDPQPAAR